MHLRGRRVWTVVALGLVVLSAALVRIAAEFYTRESPNYSRIEEGIWLGGHVPEPPPGTQAVLNLCEREDAYKVESQKWEPIRDAAPAPSLDWLRDQVGFIESERAAGRTVFVHCMNGVSRSAMVLAAYFMQRESWSRDQAIEYLQARRPVVRPNPAFMELLLEFEREHANKRP